MTRQAAEQAGMGEHWRGNMEVDILATEAASKGLPPLVDRTDYLRLLGAATKVCKGIATMLEAWPLADPKRKDLPKTRDTVITPRAGLRPHSFSWELEVGAWICFDFPLKRQRCSVIDRTSCQPLLAGTIGQTNIHSSHRIFARPVLDIGSAVQA
jgi:hypothetical protein